MDNTKNMLDYPFHRRNPCQLLWSKRRSHSQGRGIKRPLRRRLHHYIKIAHVLEYVSRAYATQKFYLYILYHLSGEKSRKTERKAPFLLRDYAPLKARLSVLEIRQEVRYEVGIHKRYMGIRGYPGSRR